MNLQLARDRADFVLKSFSIVAILAGGVWAYAQFHLTGTTESNIQLTVTTEVLPYSETTRLLVVHAKPKNIGKVPVEIEQTSFPVTVRAVPGDAKPGPIEIDKLTDTYGTDILRRFADGYRLEPGVEYDEIFVVVVRPGVYAAKATLNLDTRNEVDHTVLVQVR